MNDTPGLFYPLAIINHWRRGRQQQASVVGREEAEGGLGRSWFCWMTTKRWPRRDKNKVAPRTPPEVGARDKGRRDRERPAGSAERAALAASTEYRVTDKGKGRPARLTRPRHDRHAHDHLLVASIPGPGVYK